MKFGEGEGAESYWALKAVMRSLNLLLRALVSHSRLGA